MPLNTEVDRIINSDNERKEERSEDVSTAKVLLSTEVDSIINSDSLE